MGGKGLRATYRTDAVSGQLGSPNQQASTLVHFPCARQPQKGMLVSCLICHLCALSPPVVHACTHQPKPLCRAPLPALMCNVPCPILAHLFSILAAPPSHLCAPWGCSCRVTCQVVVLRIVVFVPSHLCACTQRNALCCICTHKSALHPLFRWLQP